MKLRSALAFLCGLVFVLGAKAQSLATLPNGQVGVSYSFQVATSPAAPSGSVYGATGLPSGVAINAATGTISGTPTASGTFTGTISITSSGTTNNFGYSLTIAAAASTPAITSSTSASATVGVAFSYAVSATNSPTSFNVGALPPGLTFTSPTISGTPTTSGTYNVSLSANNSNGTGAIVTLTITVSPAGPVPAITSSTSSSGPINVAYSYTITASNSPTGFSAVGLPLGLTLDPTTGIISGTPTIAGVSSVTLSASNSNGTGASTTLTLTIGNLSAITSASTLTATVGSPFSASLTATNSPISFNVSGLPTGLSATSAGVISGTPSVSGTFSVIASANNGTGTGPSTAITLTVNAAGGGGGGTGGGSPVTAPTFSLEPTSQTVIAGTNVTFTAQAFGTGTITYQWYFNGGAISGSTSTSLSGNATLTIKNAQASNAGAYSITATNAGGTVTSTSATLNVNALVVPVSITSQPASETVNAGDSATFSVVATASGTLTYQWSLNGAPIPGATNSTLSISNAQASNAGSYTVVVTGGGTSVTSQAGVLTVTTPVTPPPVVTSRLVNVSIRGFAGAASQTLTIGLTVGGTGSKLALVRAIGPTLATFGVGGVLPNPTLSVITNGTTVASNTVWGGTSVLSAAFVQTGAFALPANSLDSVVLASLPVGSYTAPVTSATNATGVVLLEAYDADTATNPPARFINMSARGQSGSGSDVLTLGFSISGATNKILLIRGIGPTLSQFGVSGVLPATQLTLYNSVNGSSVFVASNTAWGGTSALTSAFVQVGAFALSPSSADSALLVTLGPGSYTAQLTGLNGTTGVGLIELYEVQ